MANILSLDPSFAPWIPGESKYDNYQNLVSTYTNDQNSSHRQGHLLIHDSGWIDSLKNIDNNYFNSVHLGHAASFNWSAEYLSRLDNKKFILLKFTTKRSTEFLRTRELNMLGTDTFANSYYCEEIRNLYNNWIVIPGKIDDDINLEIEIEDLLQISIQNWVELVNKKFSLSIPIAEAQILHSLWINKLIRSGLEKFIKI